MVLTTLCKVRKFSPVVPDLGVGPLPKDHKINLGGHEMINGGWKNRED